MTDQTNLKINKIIIIAAGVVLVLDLSAKLIRLALPFIGFVKWLTTVFYPIVACYVFLFAFTFKLSDVALLQNRKYEDKVLFLIKYILFATGLLLLPSCLSFWFNFSPAQLRTLKTAVVLIFPWAAFLMITIGIKMKDSKPKSRDEVKET